MRIEFAIPDQTDNLVEIRKGEAVLQSFTATWATPDDDQSLEIQEARIEVLDMFGAERPTIASADDFRTMAGKLRAIRKKVDGLIRRHFVTADPDGFEPADLDKMLRHDIYRGGLLVSLYGVTTGEIRAKNSVTPGTSGQPDDSPVATGTETESLPA